MTDTTQAAGLTDEQNHYTVERHGNGWAIYTGRNNFHHGMNWGQLSECDESLARKIEHALNAYQPATLRGDAALAAQAVPAGWRSEAANWLRAKAEQQRKTNSEYAQHVACYPSWEKRVRDLEWLAYELDATAPAEAKEEPLRPTDDELWDQTLKERDDYHEWADQLAARIATITGVDIGEHSSANCPWQNAVDAADEHEAQIASSISKSWDRFEAALATLQPQAAQPVACVDPMCACRGGPCAECPDGEREKELQDLRSSLDFYKRRHDLLQTWQKRMRDPERTIVCDILANGRTLPDADGSRYTAAPALTEEQERMETTLKHIASLAHEGGLANLNEHGSLTHIRRLSLPYWKDSGTQADSAARVNAAVSAALRSIQGGE